MGLAKRHSKTTEELHKGFLISIAEAIDEGGNSTPYPFTFEILFPDGRNMNYFGVPNKLETFDETLERAKGMVEAVLDRAPTKSDVAYVVVRLKLSRPMTEEDIADLISEVDYNFDDNSIIGTEITDIKHTSEG